MSLEEGLTNSDRHQNSNSTENNDNKSTMADAGTTGPAGDPSAAAGGTTEGGKLNCCGPRTSVYIIKAVTICATLACGLFTCNQMIFYSGDSQKPRWQLIYFYTTVLAILLLSAEANLMRHRVFKAFTAFLTNPTGRGITMIFIGGLILLNELAGTILGILMLVAGVMNLCSWCFFPDIKKEEEQYQAAQLAEQRAQAVQQQERQRI